MSIKDVLNIAGGARISKMNKVIDEINQKTGKSKAVMFFDILSCSLKYGAGYFDYQIFEFYNMNSKERKTYMTRVKNKKLIMRMNNQEFSYIFDQKDVFDEKFKKYLGREVIDTKDLDLEKFEKFIDGKESIFVKPYIGESGKGIEKLNVADYENIKELYNYIKDKNNNFGLVEELIVQHKDVSKIYPYALNCFRIVTLVENGVPHILYAVFKMGNDGKYVDNLENGGLACSFDLDKGVINGIGHTSALINYEKHPYTGVKFIGYKIPYIEEMKKLVKEAALIVPEIKYVGWDVCITENGPAIVEGNDYPAYDFPQLPEENRPKVGLLKKIQEILPDFK